MRMKNNPNILIYDIETSLETAAVFSPKTEYINAAMMLTERHMLSAAWSWWPSRRVWSSSIESPGDDAALTTQLWTLFAHADAVVAHYGDGFDVKYVAARCAFHGLPPLKPATQVDTWKIAKRRFLLNYNRLDYISTFLGGPPKMDAPRDWWLRALRGDMAAIKLIERYNRGDIRALRYVFDKLSPWTAPAVNRALGAERGACPSCGAAALIAGGTRTTKTRSYVRYVCTRCGAWTVGGAR